jgi:hypothetical protein
MGINLHLPEIETGIVKKINSILPFVEVQIIREMGEWAVIEGSGAGLQNEGDTGEVVIKVEIRESMGEREEEVPVGEDTYKFVWVPSVSLEVIWADSTRILKSEKTKVDTQEGYDKFIKARLGHFLKIGKNRYTYPKFT